MDKKYVSIRDIANLSGVSISTVSRVIHNPETTAPDTRKRVLKVINKYGYVPNQNARNLFTGASKTIAMFVFDMQHPFFVSISQHLNRIAFENNYTLLTFQIDYDPEREMEYLEYCKSMRVSGIIYTAGTKRSEPPVDERLSIPTVIMAASENKHKDRYVIKSDYKKTMRLLVDYLSHLNHRKIGFITGAMDVLTSQERLDAFRNEMSWSGLELPESYIYHGDFSVKSGVNACDYFCSLPEMPTAIVSSNDPMAKGFIMRASSLGIRVPDDISICGIDAVDDDYFFPKLTSIHQDTEKMAQCAFDLLTKKKRPAPPYEVILDVSFRPGDTCRKIKQ